MMKVMFSVEVLENVGEKNTRKKLSPVILHPRD